MRWTLRRLPHVGEQTVRFLLLWRLAGQKWVESGSPVTRLSAGRVGPAVRCSLALAAMYAMAKAARIESFSTSAWSS